MSTNSKEEMHGKVRLLEKVVIATFDASVKIKKKGLENFKIGEIIQPVIKAINSLRDECNENPNEWEDKETGVCLRRLRETSKKLVHISDMMVPNPDLKAVKKYLQQIWETLYEPMKDSLILLKGWGYGRDGGRGGKLDVGIYEELDAKFYKNLGVSRYPGIDINL